jgi:hypothetical protein
MTTKLLIILSGMRLLFRQLYLSVTSVDFYYDVYRYYKGYGIKYLFTISFISALIISISILNNVITLKEYFQENKVSKHIENIEVILKQLPIIDYDGKNISISEETPLYLYDARNNKIAVIDTNNQLSMNEKLKIPIILTKNTINISISESNYSKQSKHVHKIIDYPKILGIEPKIYSAELIKKQLASIMDTLETIAIYIVMPIFVIVIFVFRLLENCLLITSTYLLTYLLGPQTSVQTCIRVVIFSSGARNLLHVISIVLFPEFIEFMWYIQIWCCFLLFKAIMKVREDLSH